MELKNKTKFLLVLGIIFVSFLVFNTNKVNATTNGENSSLDNIPNTIDLDIKEIEWQKAEQLVWEKLITEQKVNESDKNNFHLWVLGNDIRTARLGLNGQEKNISINYSNTKNYNENDKTYIENLLKKKDFSFTNNNYKSPQLHVSIEVGTDKIDDENSMIKVLKEYINDNSLEFTYHGGGGDITGADSSIGIFKNDIFYTNVTLNTINDFIVTVPNDIENSEDKYIDYAKSKIKSEMNINENLDIKKVSGYWYEINNWGCSLIIRKQEGTPIGNNIFVNNLPINVNVTVTPKENNTMEKEIKNKGYNKILASYELTLTGTDKLESPIDITFNVGTEHNGKTVYILHQKKNGNYENFEKKVDNGKVTVTVSELSPFILGIKEDTPTTPNDIPTETVDKGEKDETPKTGTIDIIGYVSLITLISLVGIVKLKKGEEKKMKLKTNFKILLMFGIMLGVMLFLGTTKVNATEISDYKCKIEKDGYIFYNNYFNTSDVDTEVKKEIDNSIHIYSNKSGINTSTLNDIVNNFKNGKCLVEVSNDVTEAKVIRTVGAPFETKEVEESAEIVVLNNKRYVVVNSRMELSESSMNDKNYTHVWLDDDFTIKINDKEQLFVLKFEFYSTDYFRCDVKVVSETGITYGCIPNTNGIVFGMGLEPIPAKLDLNKCYVEYLSNTYLGETLNIECLGKVPYVGKYGNVYKYKMNLKDVKINEVNGIKTIPLANFSYKDSFEVGAFELDPNYTIDNETYVEQTKTNTSTKLKFDLRGNFKGTLKAEEISKNDLIYNKVNEELEKNVIGNYLFMDISNIYIEDGSYEGPLKLTFYVGEQYNGKYYSICHMKDYMYSFEKFNGIVENGKIEITVDSLSPFGISIFEKKEDTPTTDSTPKVDKGEKDETPKTGTVDIIGYVLGVTLLTGVGIVELKKRLK